MLHLCVGQLLIEGGNGEDIGKTTGEICWGALLLQFANIGTGTPANSDGWGGYRWFNYTHMRKAKPKEGGERERDREGEHERAWTCTDMYGHAPTRRLAWLDDGWPESEKDVFQAALRMVVVKDSRWIVGEFYMSPGKIWCEKVRLIKKRIFGKGHQMTYVLQPQRERGGRDKERERERERKRKQEREREWKGG